MILKHKISYFEIKNHGKQTSFLALRRESCKNIFYIFAALVVYVKLHVMLL